MDTDFLVENKVEDGQRLINLLIREQFDVGVAFWVRTSEDSLWQLWLASSAVGPGSMGDALRKVYAVLSKIPDCGVSPSEITLIESANPIARAAMALRDRYHSRIPVRFHGKRLASLATEELFIYPRRFPLEVREREGHWEVLISEPDDVWLTCDSEEDARAIAAARVLEYEALAQLRTGPQFAAELERTADVMERYRMGFGSRFLRRRAQEMRVTAEGPGQPALRT